MGTGGLGGYIGGRLAQSGQDVSFIARGAQLQTIQQYGLHVKTVQDEFHVHPAQATNHPSEVGPVDLIILIVKAYDVVEAIESMRPMIGPQTSIIPVLNGIEHIQILGDKVRKEHVLGGRTYTTAHLVSPGVVERQGTHGELEFGELVGDATARTEALQEVLGIEGLKGTVVPDITKNMWEKFAIMCGVAMFSVIRGDAELLRSTPEALEVTWQAASEGIAVAQAKGIALEPSLVDALKGMVTNAPPDTKPSMLVDLEKGKRIEVEALNGSLSRLGKEVGVPTPVNDFIYAALKPYVHGRP